MLRRFAVALALGLTAATSWCLVGVPEAEARSVYPLSNNQMVDASDLVMRGVVSEVWAEKDEKGDIWTLTALEVTHVYKGDSTTRRVIVHQLGGVLNGETHVLSVASRFSPGEEVLLFLETNRFGKRLVVGGDLGKFTLRIDPDNGEQMLVRTTLPQDLYYDHRFLPHPPVDQRVYLADMEAEIEARVVEGWDGQPIPGASMERLERVNQRSQGVER